MNVLQLQRISASTTVHRLAEDLVQRQRMLGSITPDPRFTYTKEWMEVDT